MPFYFHSEWGMIRNGRQVHQLIKRVKGILKRLNDPDLMGNDY